MQERGLTNLYEPARKATICLGNKNDVVRLSHYWEKLEVKENSKSDERWLVRSALYYILYFLDRMILLHQGTLEHADLSEKSG